MYVHARKKHGENVVEWLKDNYELSDTAGCISKASVYQDYLNMCQEEGLHPTTGPAFGKLVRRAFPSVVSNRRGPRGHALHMYSGLQKRSSRSTGERHVPASFGEFGNRICISSGMDAIPTSKFPDPEFQDYPNDRSPHEMELSVNSSPRLGAPVVDITPAPFPAIATSPHSGRPSNSTSPTPSSDNNRSPGRYSQTQFSQSRLQYQPTIMDLDGRSFGGQPIYQANSAASYGEDYLATRTGATWAQTSSRTESFPDIAAWSPEQHGGISSSSGSGSKFTTDYARHTATASFTDLQDWITRTEKGDSSEELSTVIEAVDEIGEPPREPPRPQMQGNVGWGGSAGSRRSPLSSPPWPTPSSSPTGQRQQTNYPNPMLPTRPHSQSAPPEYQEPTQAAYYSSDIYGRTSLRRQSHPPPNNSNNGAPFGQSHNYGPYLTVDRTFSSLATQSSPVSHLPPPSNLSSMAQGGILIPRSSEELMRLQRPSPSSTAIRSADPAEYVTRPSSSTPIVFDSTPIDGRHKTELSAFTSVCRLYYSNIYQCIITYNLDALRLEIERFWDFVAKDFPNILCYEYIHQRILQIETSIFHELTEILMNEDLGLGIEQFSVYLHNLAFVLPTWLSQARKSILPALVFAALHETVSNFAMQLYRQSLRLQKLANSQRGGSPSYPLPPPL